MSTTVIVGNIVMLAGCVLLVIAANAKTDVFTVRLQTIQQRLFQLSVGTYRRIGKRTVLRNSAEKTFGEILKTC